MLNPMPFVLASILFVLSAHCAAAASVRWSTAQRRGGRPGLPARILQRLVWGAFRRAHARLRHRALQGREFAYRFALALALVLVSHPASAEDVSDQAINDVRDAIERLMEGYRRAVALGQQERAIELLHMANETDRVVKQWEVRRDVLLAAQCRSPQAGGGAGSARH